MSHISDRFKITGDKKFSHKDFDPADTADYKKEDADELLADLVGKTADAETELYASNKYALLIIFQAMDAAGKDSAIKHTMSGLNPQGCQVYSFKEPSAEELDHDFLWRHYKALPERGRIGIHNRSHYENVLITQVHPELLEHEDLPQSFSQKKMGKDFWKQRYKSIRNFEEHLHYNGTVIIKFFLHVSKDEQRKRFLERIDDPSKNWKFSASDVTERAYWDKYMKAYEKAIMETATKENPWYIIPADKKWFTRIALSTIILDHLRDLKLSYPVLPESEKEKLKVVKEELQNE
ncbi:MAG TPA: polyphosphate kinase 2 family protein [Mucilaginibacter sp.]|jgi:PPK2 family polyphosphate:nucleotide phosphotransferase|nr:polyphosphate kinase 2 family protein [Mucilaginibacter sp.]